jgi:ABC-type uncharacterized transport system permease subunit
VIHLIVAVIAGLIAGAIWGGIVGFLKARTGAHEVIVTIMLNYVAAAACCRWLLLHARLPAARAASTRSHPVIHDSAPLPRSGLPQLHVGFLVALAAAAVACGGCSTAPRSGSRSAPWAPTRTPRDRRHERPNVTMITMALSGLLCGLAGVQYALGPGADLVATPLSIGLVGTVGFDAITVALLGRSKPLGTVLAGLLFGGLHAGGLAMQSIAQTPLTLSTVLQALIVLFVAAPALVGALLPKIKAPAATSLVGGEA